MTDRLRKNRESSAPFGAENVFLLYVLAESFCLYLYVTLGIVEHKEIILEMRKLGDNQTHAAFCNKHPVNGHERGERQVHQPEHGLLQIISRNTIGNGFKSAGRLLFQFTINKKIMIP